MLREDLLSGLLHLTGRGLMEQSIRERGNGPTSSASVRATQSENDEVETGACDVSATKEPTSGGA